jgi:ArsR family transcriptional regulator
MTSTAANPVDEVAVPCCPPLAGGELTAAEAERAASLFRALGEPVRLRLVSKVAAAEDGEACVCDLLDVGVSQPTVSHHLKKLREAGVLTSRKQGTWVYYRLAPGVLASMAAILEMPR